MDLTGADIPDDENPPEPHDEDSKAPEETHNAVKLVIIHIHRNLVHLSKELFCRAL